MKIEEKERGEERCRLVNGTFLVTVLFYLGASISLSGILAKTDSILLRLTVSQLILAAPTAGYLILVRQPFCESIRLKPLKPTRILLMLLFALLVLPFMSFINALSLLVTTNQATAELQELTRLPFVVSLLFVALLPAVLEETVYRGVFFQEYRKIHIRKGILLSGFLFGLMHLNLNQFSYAFAMGCIFAVVIEATDTILSTMLIHFAINAFSTVMTYLTAELPILEQAEGSAITMTDVLQIGAAAVIPTILAVWILVWLSRLEGRGHIWSELVGKGAEEKKHLLTMPLLAGMLICIGYMIVYELSIR